MRKNRNKRMAEAQAEAPLNEHLPASKRTESCLKMSDLVLEMATFIICHILVDHEEWLAEERHQVANALLQRVTSTHLCNHQLTRDGIAYCYHGEEFSLREAYKTMTLTRTVYEHLAMFYFLYVYPESDEERTVSWNYWKINSLKSLSGTAESGEGGDAGVLAEIERMRSEIFATRLGQTCRRKLDEWTSARKGGHSGSLLFSRNADGSVADVRRLSYSQAWRMLFGNDDMALLYSHLSMHCHPVYNGLLQYESQDVSDESYDGMPLYLSACFLASLCHMFTRLVPGMERLLAGEFSKQQLCLLAALAKVPSEVRL